MKKLLSMLLCLAMVLSMAACANNANTEPESPAPAPADTEPEDTTSAEPKADDPYADIRISDEVITLTVAGPSGATEINWNESLQFAEYEKRLGLKFDAKTYTNEQWASKVTLLFATDEMPDIIGCANVPMSRSDVMKYAEDGYFLDLSQYLDIMPNFKAALDASEAFRKSVTFDDGGIYGITTYNTFGLSGKYNYNVMSETFLDNLGLERPETLDELYNVLVAIKENDANGNGDPDDEIPMAYAGKTRFYTELPIRYAYGINSSNYTYMPYADENGKVFAYDTTENYREFLRFMNKLYTEGLINNDCYVVNVAEIDELAQAGKVGYCAQSGGVGASKELQDLNKWFQFFGVTNEGYQDKRITVLDTKSAPWTFALLVNANTEHPEEICKFIDYMFTPEGGLSGGNGYDGVTFDADYIEGYMIPNHNKKAEEAGLDAGTYRNQVLALGCFRFTVLANGTIYDLLNNIDYDDLCAAIEDTSSNLFANCTINAVKAEGLRNPANNIVDAFPSLFYTDEESATRGTLMTDLNNYLELAKAQFITGELDLDKDWDAYVAKVNEIGLQELIAIEQAAYDRFTK